MQTRTASLVPGAVIEYLPGHAAVLHTVTCSSDGLRVKLEGWVLGTKDDYAAVTDSHDTMSVIGMTGTPWNRNTADFGTTYTDRFTRHLV